MTTIVIKNSQVINKVPSGADLQVGELAINTADAKLFTKHTDGAIKIIGGTSGGGGSGGGIGVIIENSRVISTNYIVSSGNNAMSVGPIMLTGITAVTLPPYTRWIIR